MKRISTSGSWVILAILGILAAILLILNVELILPEKVHSLLQAIAEALIVSIVVALVVEPRLLRHFGEELASQTFWTSFYSRAPGEYRQAIKELASATQFANVISWKVTLDWSDEEQSMIRLDSEIIDFRENRGEKPYPHVPRTFIYESPFPSRPAAIEEYQVLCESITFHGNPVEEGYSLMRHEKDGRLVIIPADDSAKTYLQIPPGAKYAIIAKATTFASTPGHAPLVITTPTLSLEVELRGSALHDLWVSILHPGLGRTTTVISETGAALASKGPIRVGGICVTGQAILLSWARIPGGHQTVDDPSAGHQDRPIRLH